MSKGRNKYKWADGGNAPLYGPALAVERNIDILDFDTVQQNNRHHWTWDVDAVTWVPGHIQTAAYAPLNDGQLFDLMALGYTGDEIKQLEDLVARSLYSGPDRIFYRHQARQRNKPVFGFNRLYKKSHELGPKRLDGTVVWMRTRGFRWPFPEVGDGH